MKAGPGSLCPYRLSCLDGLALKDLGFEGLECLGFGGVGLEGLSLEDLGLGGIMVCGLWP